MISERWVLPPPVWTFLSVQSHSWGKCWRKRVQAAGVIYGPDLRVQLSKRSKLIAPVSISTCPPSHTRCRQTCWLLRIFRPGDTLKSLLPLWILSIRPRHHPMTKHVQEEFLFVVCTREEVLAFQAIKLCNFSIPGHTAAYPNMSMSVPSKTGSRSIYKSVH